MTVNATESDQDFARWVLRSARQESPSVRLLCIPWAGSGTSAYHGWIDALPPAVEPCMLRLPGREMRRQEPPVSRMSELVERAAAACATGLTGPFAIFGHSSGALIGYELARQLERRHQREPLALIVSAQPAPHLAPRHAPIHDLPAPQFLDALDERCHGVPQALRDDPEMQEVYLPAMRADVALEETYSCLPGAPLSCPVAVFGGVADEEAREQDLRPWEQHTRGAFALRMLPGDHFFFQTARDAMIAEISAQLLGH